VYKWLGIAVAAAIVAFVLFSQDFDIEKRAQAAKVLNDFLASKGSKLRVHVTSNDLEIDGRLQKDKVAQLRDEIELAPLAVSATAIRGLPVQLRSLLTATHPRVRSDE
jgi:hypothetical protein